MQIVIEIPSAMYNDIKSGKEGYSNYVHTAIRIGTPLPKGHGRIDGILVCDGQTIIEAEKESEGLGMNYFKHLWLNWRVAFHALTDFFAHFVHGLFPCIKIKHHQPVSIKKESEDKE